MKKKIYLLLTVLIAGVGSAWADDLASVITKSADVTISSIVNESSNAWVVEGDSIALNADQTNNNWQYSEFTVNYESANDMVVEFYMFNGGGGSYDQFYVYKDGSEYTNFYGVNASYKRNFYRLFLTAGQHSLRFYSKFYSKTSTSSSFHGLNDKMSVNLSIVTAESQYMDVNLSAPGTLGLEVLSQVSSLPAMHYMRLTGQMNADDWATIRQMTGLWAVDMTNAQITEIPASAFTSNSIRYFKFPTTLKTIGNSAFYNRVLTGPLNLPDGLETIGYQAFQNNYITDVTIPASVTSIGYSAFKDNDALKTVTLGGGFDTLPYDIFYSCEALTDVYGGASIKHLQYNAFNYCTSLRDVHGMKPLRVDYQAFENCKNLEAIDLSEATQIGGYAFYNCDKLASIDLSSLQSFSNWYSSSSSNGYAFNNCDLIEEVVIPDRVTTIPESTFHNCQNLKSVTLGASLSSIGSYAFYSNNGSNVQSLTKLYCNAPTPPSVNTSYPPVWSPTSCVLYVPEYAMVSYKLDTYWSKFTTVEVNPNQVENLTINSKLELTSNARVPDTPNVVVNRGGSLIVNGNNAQDFGTFTSYFSIGTNANIISRCNAITSTFTESRYWLGSSSTPYWYFISLPYDVNVADITTSNGAQVVVRYYDGASRAANGSGGNWKDVPSDGTLQAGQGYIFCASAGCYVYLPATAATRNQIFRSEAVTLNLNEYATETSSNKSWNLVGNPYPCYYDIYHMDFTAPLTVWSTDNRTYTAYSIADDDLALLPMQAFFVQKPDLVNDITFQTGGRQITSTIDHSALAPRRAPSASNRRIVNLTLTDGSTTDKTRVVVNPTASDAYDCETDAAKMLSFDGTAQLYTVTDNEMYAINEGAHTSGLIDLGMWMSTSGSYTIDASRADIAVQLLDNGAEVEMPYTFNASSGYNEGRFQLRVAVADLTGIDSLTSSDNAKTGSQTIYTLDGRAVSAENLPKGVYIQKGKKFVK